MIGVRPLTRKTKQVYQIAFRFMGVQCREIIDLVHSKSNLAYCERRRAAILTMVAKGEFDYAREFPKSKRAKLFGHGGGRRALLRDLLEAYRDRVEKTFEPSTFAGTKTAIDNYLVPWCGAIAVADFKRSHVRDWVGKQTVSLKRINNLLLPLRAVLNEAVGDGAIESNPLIGMKLAKLVPVAQRSTGYDPQPYSESEIVTLLAKLPEPERWAFQLWAYTGVRTGELIGLRWHRVDLEANTIHIQETTTSGEDKARPKTPAGIRKIVLLPAAREALDKLRAVTQIAGDRVTVNPRGARADGAWDDRRLAEIWRRAHANTGIAYRNPYQLRHTAASNLLSQGENIQRIARMLGHKTIEMLIRNYGRWVDEGEKVGAAGPARRYGQERLWGDVARAKRVIS